MLSLPKRTENSYQAKSNAERTSFLILIQAKGLISDNKFSFEDTHMVQKCLTCVKKSNDMGDAIADLQVPKEIHVLPFL